MASTFITSSNSQATQLADLTANAFLLVTEGGYITDTSGGSPAYFANAGGASATIKGTLINFGTYGGGIQLGATNSYASGGGNSLTITSSGYVQGISGAAIFGGNNTVVNAGMMRSIAISDPAGDNKPAGLYLLGDANTVTNSGSIVGFYGIYAEGGRLRIINTGDITSTSNQLDGQFLPIPPAAIRTLGPADIDNSGTISGTIDIHDNLSSVSTVNNTGTVTGGIMIDGRLTVNNHGTIAQGITTHNGADSITNFGTIGDTKLNEGSDSVENKTGGVIQSISFGVGAIDDGADTFYNYGEVGSVNFGISSDQFLNIGLVTNGVNLSDGANNVSNFGTIYFGISTGSGADVVFNSGLLSGLSTGGGADLAFNVKEGVILGVVDLGGTDAAIDKLTNDGVIGTDFSIFAAIPTVAFGDGADIFTNTGTIYGSVDMGAGNDVDTLTNSGLISGTVTLGGGNDIVDTSAGTIGGRVDLGTGADSYTGGDGVDRVIGGTGNDVIDLGSGADVYFAVNADGVDQIDGGDGIDRYDASAATQACIVDLSAGTTTGLLGADTILNFENVTGGAAADTLTGSDGANRIDGGMGADKIDGGAGADRLIGGTGADTITGGVGRDVMTGGQTIGSTDSDTFVFRASDSGTTAATRDVITDFTDHGSNAGPFATGADLIDLHLIDAATGTAGDQAFTFNAVKGAAFSGVAGSLIWQQYNGFALISGDTNGDKIADFTIQLNGTHTLFASDFVL